ncbi:C25 family cysteine peptidase [Ralstonia syzygii]|uniref:Uncharacterized protein n=1 Tax=Ralstonia syzygii R24 TaxID=907261 RepID=G3A7U7_9RALS|nr:C25 family cysteine peptidase [Ralstonia syzygii]CCA86583.1 conserved hypothetical protein [Ralstonia syzygii R24]
MKGEVEGPFPFGVHAATGRPLEGTLACKDIVELLAEEDHGRRVIGGVVPVRETFSLQFGLDPNELKDAGWGLVFEAGTDPAPYLESLADLVELRRQEAENRFRVFSGADGYRSGESASDWLTRHGASLNQIDPDYGVPYYLVIVGPPSSIPFAFQYSLDIVAAVGRLDFPSFDAFKAYARSVATFEKDTARQTRRCIELFATCHDFDRATQLFTKHVAKPLSSGDDMRGPLGSRYGFSVNASLGDQSTKANLARLLSNTERAPSILFTGTHGIAFNAIDPRQIDNQGALICQDWPGYGSISSEHWFAAQDVPPDANVHGLIHVFFACYGAGTPEFDSFKFETPNVRIAPGPMTARLPQKLMTLPQGGVLASLGHIDRAWASSFQGRRGAAQTQGFREVIDRLLAGQRIGLATDNFNNQWGVLSTELADMLNYTAYGKELRESDLLALRIARDDCRNYVVLGDPAVKLRPEAGLGCARH